MPSSPFVAFHLPNSLFRSAPPQLFSGHNVQKPSKDDPAPMFAHSARYCEPVIRDVEGLGDDTAWRCCGDQPYSTPRGSDKNRGYGTWRPLTTLQVPPLATATSLRSPRFSSGIFHSYRAHIQSVAEPSASRSPPALHDERGRESEHDRSRGAGGSGAGVPAPSSSRNMRSSSPPQKTSMLFQRFRKSLGTNVVVELLDAAHDSAAVAEHHEHASSSAPLPAQGQAASATSGADVAGHGRAGGGRVSVVLGDGTAGATHSLAKLLPHQKHAHKSAHEARCVEWSEESKVRMRVRGRESQIQRLIWRFRGSCLVC